MNYLKKLLRYFLKGVLFIAGFVFLYLLMAFFLTIIPSNYDCKQPAEGIEIFVVSNGVHTDVVVPVQTEIIDWTKHVPLKHFRPEAKPFSHISFGWGDKGFYLDTPTWADLKFSTAFNALFGGAPTAMHVVYETGRPQPGEQTRKIILGREQYQKLSTYIQSSFQKDRSGNFILIDCCRYPGLNDSFYEAEGMYHLFKTCNVWTNNALKAIGVKTAFWAPFDRCVTYHLE